MRIQYIFDPQHFKRSNKTDYLQYDVRTHIYIATGWRIFPVDDSRISPLTARLRPAAVYSDRRRLCRYGGGGRNCDLCRSPPSQHVLLAGERVYARRQGGHEKGPPGHSQDQEAAQG